MKHVDPQSRVKRNPIKSAIQDSTMGGCSIENQNNLTRRRPCLLKNLLALTAITLSLGVQVICAQETRAQSPYVGGVKGVDLMPNYDKNKSKLEKANAYLRENGEKIGIKNADRDLKLKRARTDNLGITTLTHQQEYNGIPVVGAEVKSHFDERGNLYVVTQTVEGELAVDTTPTITQATAEATASQMVVSDEDPLTDIVLASRLTILNPSILKGQNDGTSYLAYEVQFRAKKSDGMPVDETVYVDAHQGGIILRSNNIHDSLQRRAYDLQGNLDVIGGLKLIYPGSPVWVEGDTLPDPITEVTRAMQFSKSTYDLFYTLFGRDGPDFNGSLMDSVVNWGVANAFNDCTAGESKQLSVFGQVSGRGIATDDIVGHEWGHCYHTNSTGGFLYAYQAGAIGEAFSDITGLVVDSYTPDNFLYKNDDSRDVRRKQVTDNGGACTYGSKAYLGTWDAPPPTLPTENSLRWIVSEDWSIRDAWNPHCTNNPDKVTDTTRYICSFVVDNGGVHRNAPILTHAFALLSDGGTFNGQNIRKIGMDKAFPIFYRALDTYNTPTTNFSQYADNLTLACNDLVGTKVKRIKSLRPLGSMKFEDSFEDEENDPDNFFGEIKRQDCEQVQKAILATELKAPTSCPTESINLIAQSNVVIPQSDSCGSSNGRICESLIGDVLSDVSRSQLGTDFYLQNSGGIRAALTCPITDNPLDPCPAYDTPPPPFVITDGQVARAVPFNNLLVKVRVSGVQIKDILENGVSIMPFSNGRYPQVSGLCFTYDIARTARTTIGTGNRVTQVVLQAPDGSCSNIPLDLNDTTPRYLLGTLDFVANGGDGYPALPIEGGLTYGTQSAVAIQGLKNKLVTPTIQGRSQCITSNPAKPCPIKLP
jgi:Zn-dependent metalloprotease